MARIEDIERRLLNWARWKHGAGAGGLGYASVNYMALTGEDRDQGAEPVIPTFDCEASETDGAVMALPSELRATVEVVYVLGGGMAAKARRLAVTEVTVWARVARAHPLIEAWVYDRAAKRRELQAELQRRLLAARSQ
jgi:hypothetical protein